MDRPTSVRPGGSAEPAPTGPRPEPAQRWRITFARDVVAADRVGRVALEEWQAALAASRLPMADVGGLARLAIAAPLPANARGERELAEIWLVERWPAWAVREHLAPALPDGHRWIGAEDIWLGAPAVVGQVTAADWRIEMEPLDASAHGRLAVAVDEINAARAIPRTRLKGTTEKRYDLRPLLAELRLALAPIDAAGTATPTIVARTRFHPELGSGRPDEVVAALAETAGIATGIRSMTRTRLVLADDADGADTGAAAPDGN